jgi:hypothetical protein
MFYHQKDDICPDSSEDEDVGTKFVSADEATSVFQCGLILTEMATLTPHICNMRTADALMIDELPKPPGHYSESLSTLIDFICKENRH